MGRRYNRACGNDLVLEKQYEASSAWRPWLCVGHPSCAVMRYIAEGGAFGPMVKRLCSKCWGEMVKLSVGSEY